MVDERIKLISAWADRKRGLGDEIGRALDQIANRGHGYVVATAGPPTGPVDHGNSPERSPGQSRGDRGSPAQISKMMDLACWAGWAVLAVGLARAAFWAVMHY